VTCRSREGLRLAVQLYAGTPEHYMAVLKAAEEFSGWLEHCPPDPSSGDLAGVLAKIINNEEKIMSALTDLQAADQSLKDEVTAFLNDIAGRLSSVDDASAEAVVADITAEVDALQAADPANAAPAPSPEPAPPATA
jgi:hypothetical protein